MRALKSTVPVAILVLSLFAPTLRAAAPSDQDQPAERKKGPSNVLDLAQMLSGNWKGVTPGNELTANLMGTGFTGSTQDYNLSVTILGKYRDTNIWLQGVLHLSNQGRDLFVAYIPHFDPSRGGVGLQALRFTREELDAACSFYMGPEGDGYAGDTRGSTTCTRAIRGAIGKWTLKVEPGTIVLRSVQSGETLRFQKSAK